jgi:peptidoglycan/LPS O-acetylase OafA/YrhL
MERAKLNTLTSLRFFAAGLVFLYHYARGIPGAPKWFLSLSSHGFAAVTFFFVLSGFILAYSYLDEEKPGHLKGTRKAFWISRVSRIYPLYLLALLVALPAYAYGTARGRNSLSDSALGLVLVPTMVQAWMPTVAIEWNPPAWSLSVEAVFYILFPFLIRPNVRGNGWGLLLLSFVLVCCASVTCEWLWRLKIDGSAAINYNWRNFLQYFPLFHLPSFLVGLALGRTFVQPSPGRLGLQTLAFWGSLVALTGVLLGRSSLPAFFYSQPALILLFSGVIFFGAKTAAAQRDPILSSPLLILLGDASYALYILQAPLSSWFELLLKRLANIDQWTRSPFLVAVFFLLLTGASVLSFEFVEKPCRRLIQKRFRTPVYSLPRPADVVA